MGYCLSFANSLFFCGLYEDAGTGTSLTWLNSHPIIGEWIDPFQKGDKDSPAFALVELLYNDDDCPPIFYTLPVTRVKVELVDVNN